METCFEFRHSYMYRNTFLALLFLASVSVLCANDFASPFYSGSFEHMRAKAASEQKPYCLYLSLRECEDCDKMEETTFRNISVSDFLSEHFLTYKYEANAEDEASLIFPRKYVSMQIFPALIIFNPEGDIQFMEAGYLPPEYLMEKLKDTRPYEWANNQTNPSKLMESQLEILMSGVPPLQFEDEEEKAQDLHQQPATAFSTPFSTATEDFPEPVGKKAYENGKSDVGEEVILYKAQQSNGSGLFRLFQQVYAGQQWGMQVGAYVKRTGLDRALHDLHALGHVNTIVHKTNYNGKTIYRIIVGPFPNEVSAQQYQNNMERSQWKNGVVRPLGSF